MPSLRTRVNYDRIALQQVDAAVAVAQAAAAAAEAAVDAVEGDVTIINLRTESARQFLALD